jgi:hypothetical protein
VDTSSYGLHSVRHPVRRFLCARKQGP